MRCSICDKDYSSKDFIEGSVLRYEYVGKWKEDTRTVASADISLCSRCADIVHPKLRQILSHRLLGIKIQTR